MGILLFQLESMASSARYWTDCKTIDAAFTRSGKRFDANVTMRPPFATARMREFSSSCRPCGSAGRQVARRRRGPRVHGRQLHRRPRVLAHARVVELRRAATQHRRLVSGSQFIQAPQRLSREGPDLEVVARTDIHYWNGDGVLV